MNIWTIIFIISVINLMLYFRRKRKEKKSLKESQRQEKERLLSEAQKRKEKEKTKLVFGLSADAPDDAKIPFDKICSWEDGENGMKILRFTPAVPVTAYCRKCCRTLFISINGIGVLQYNFGIGELIWEFRGAIIKSNDIIARFEEGLEAHNRVKEKEQAEIERRTKIIVINEKDEIAKKLKEKHRKRELEKIVRQELIDSGELFGDEPKRPPIPREVVDAVYKRDGGKCVYCGSVENLQLDHIIPFSKGGATTLENLQLLCQKCNLEKSNHIG